jgi:hypothetical protein
MDLHITLAIITVAGLAISCIAGIASQLWKDSIEVEGRLTKRLTPAGWLSLGISLVGLSGSIASELIRVSISNSEKLQSKAEAAQRQVLQEQETRWKEYMRTMLAQVRHLAGQVGKQLADLDDSVVNAVLRVQRDPN